MRKLLVVFCFIALVFAMSVQANPISSTEVKHPNLLKAQEYLDQASQKITDAQKVNEFDMAGHAAKAKDLISQASSELKLAAVEATEHTPAKPSAHEKTEHMENKTANNINETKHRNLAVAQDLVGSAYQRIMDAQKANEFDMGGHAAKAKTLLEDASKELKAAATEASEHKK